MEIKKCSKCGLEKDLTEFHCSKRSLDGRVESCKVCKNSYRKEHYKKSEHSEKTYNDSRSISRKQYDVWWRSLTPDERLKLKTDRAEKIDKIAETKRLKISEQKEFREKRKAARQLELELKRQKRIAELPAKTLARKAREKENARLKYIHQYHTDPLFKLKECLKRRAIKVFKRNNWSRDMRSSELLGADFETVKSHIESLFQPGMSWMNHGVGSGCWHIDHRVPLDSALTKAEVYPLFHYTNLQPLWSADNIRKSNSMPACQ